MSKIFHTENALMGFLWKVSNLLWINILTLVCSVPVVTHGAAVTAMHGMLLLLAREEEGNITREYFRLFKENFKQATGMWMIVLVVFLVLGGDAYLIYHQIVHISVIFLYPVLLILLVWFWIYLYAFPLLSRFDNTVPETLKNAFIFSITSFWRTLVMFLICLVPIAVLLVSLRTIPFVLAFGMSVPGYFRYKIYNPLFSQYEPDPKEICDEVEEDEDQLFRGM